MPLVVPGINNKASSNDPKEEWMNKLAGKKLSDSSTDSTVRLLTFSSSLETFTAQAGLRLVLVQRLTEYAGEI